MAYVNVAPAKVHTGDILFTYKCSANITTGDIVKIPYGKKICFGVVAGKIKKPDFEVKDIVEKTAYSLPTNSIKLMLWMFDFYPEDNGLIAQQFLPSNINVDSRTKSYDPIAGIDTPLPTPTKEQIKALSIIKNNKNQRVLLHGDTGTGKTRVFIDRAIDYIKQGQSVIILVPEIGLTPQLIDDLKKHIKTNIVLTHSDLSSSKRKAIWEYSVKNHEPCVFVGPRSAMYLPFNNIGLIVVDEAHDSSYKQNQSPRYYSLHIAAKLAQIHKAQLILSTATPNIDDYEKVKLANYQVTRLKEIAAGDSLSTTNLVDLKNRDLFKKNYYLSDPLIDAINEALTNDQQSMLFFNRRGSSRLIQCNKCGFQELCPNCGIPLIYHHDLHQIFCHSCNYKETAPSKCKSCNSTDILYKNIGIKSLVDQVQNTFKKAKIMRFDTDSLSSEKYYKHINTIKDGDVDIIIGTQMITKGIDLKKLSVVGVIDADSGLNLPDFRSEEITFQQLYQVTGRVARGHTLSKSFVQTRIPLSPVMEAISTRSWDKFYKYEISKRTQYNYPPKCFLGLIKVNRRSSKSAQIYAASIIDKIKPIKNLHMLGPSPCFIEKSLNNYYWQIVVKSNKRSIILKAFKSLPQDITVDIDPISLL